MAHHNHVLDTQLGDRVRQNADRIDIAGHELVGYITLGEECPRRRVEDGALGYTGVAVMGRTPEFNILGQDFPQMKHTCSPRTKSWDSVPHQSAPSVDLDCRSWQSSRGSVCSLP